MPDPHRPEARARAKQLNARIGTALLPILGCLALARGLQELSTPFAVLAFAIGVGFWIYMVTLVVRRLRVR